MEQAPQNFGPYIMVKSIGEGTTGKVKLAIERATNKQYAIKVISKSLFERKPHLQVKIQREIALMRLVDHPHVLKLIDVLESPRNFYIVLEYASRGELFAYIVEHGSLPEAESVRLFRQLIYGLEFLHSLGICHRDLKPENILLDENLNVKIADFGFARFVKANIAETSCGSPHYAAPEVIAGVPYDGKCADVWSCGVILYALLAGHLPFDDPSIRVLLNKVKSGKYQIPPTFSPGARDFIQRLLVLNPAKRISIPAMKMQPYFRLGLPPDYVVPHPLPIPSMQMPIMYDTIQPEAIDVLRKIGYTDNEELISELTSPEHSMAKVFYYMLTSKVAIDQLDWSRAVGGPSFGHNADEPFMVGPSMTAFTVSGADPFHRNPSVNPGGSLEAGMSLASRPEWAMPDSEPVAVMQTFDIEAHLTTVETMMAVQFVVSKLEMQWFYPDDFMIIARFENAGLYVVFQCMPADDVTRLQVQLCRGTPELFVVVCQRIEEVISMMPSRMTRPMSGDFPSDAPGV